MSQAVQFAAPQNLWFLLALPLALGLLLLGWRARKRARASWAGQLFERLAPGYDPQREWVKIVLVLCAWGCIVLALARPQWGGEMVMMKRKGIDLMLAVDVSASMLAEDMRPNRLEQAKREISDLVDRMQGDRIGLIAFAGQAFTVCPLTLDHGTVLLLLESLNINTVSTPGTNLGEAIAKARAAFVAGQDKHKALVLVTDGESHEGNPLDEAKKAKEEGLLIYTIGMGSAEGEPIPERDQFGGVSGYKKDRSGHVVTSRLDEQTLLAVAQETGGRYFRGTPQTLELSKIAEELQQVEKKELEGNLATSYEERYQWPLGLATLLLAWELVLPARRRRRGAKDLAPAARAWLLPWALPAALVAAVLSGWVSGTLAATPDVSRSAAKLNQTATQAYEAEKYDKAVDAYTEALTEAPESPAISYNLGNALYREQMLDDATKALGRAAQTEDPQLRHRSLHNLGNTFFRMGKLPEAVEAYRHALAADPSDLDTKINFEKSLQMLQEQEKEQQQQQKQDQQKKQQGEEEQQKRGQQGEQQQNQNQQQQQQQQEKESGESQEQPQQPQEQEAKEVAADTTAVAAGELSQEEAMRILEAMRQREKELQKEKALKARARARRVEKDW